MTPLREGVRAIACLLFALAVVYALLVLNLGVEDQPFAGEERGYASHH